MADADGVAEVDAPVWNDARTAMLVAVSLEEGVEDPAPLEAVTAAVAADHPDLPSGRRATSPRTGTSTTRSPRTCRPRRGSACR